MSDNPPVAMMLLPVPLLIATVVAVIVGFATSWLWAVIAFVVIALAVAAAAYLFAEPVALKLLGARPLNEQGSLQLRNQLEELCARTGVVEPDLYTVGEGAPAIASVGRKGNSLVVTDGLSDDLTVVELEAAVARELARAQSGSTTIDTLAVTFLTLPFGPFGGLANKALRFFRGGDHDARTDLDGIAITRYPPGMTAALNKMGDRPSGPGAVAHLWAVDSRTASERAGSYGFEERIALLREL